MPEQAPQPLALSRGASRYMEAYVRGLSHARDTVKLAAGVEQAPEAKAALARAADQIESTIASAKEENHA